MRQAAAPQDLTGQAVDADRDRRRLASASPTAKGGPSLFTGILQTGQTFTVPATAARPLLRTGRPQMLRASAARPRPRPDRARGAHGRQRQPAAAGPRRPRRRPACRRDAGGHAPLPPEAEVPRRAVPHFRLRPRSSGHPRPSRLRRCRCRRPRRNEAVRRLRLATAAFLKYRMRQRIEDAGVVMRVHMIWLGPAGVRGDARCRSGPAARDGRAAGRPAGAAAARGAAPRLPERQCRARGQRRRARPSLAALRAATRSRA